MRNIISRGIITNKKRIITTSSNKDTIIIFNKIIADKGFIFVHSKPLLLNIYIDNNLRIENLDITNYFFPGKNDNNPNIVFFENNKRLENDFGELIFKDFKKIEVLLNSEIKQNFELWVDKKIFDEI